MIDFLARTSIHFESAHIGNGRLSCRLGLTGKDFFSSSVSSKVFDSTSVSDSSKQQQQHQVVVFVYILLLVDIFVTQQLQKSWLCHVGHVSRANFHKWLATVDDDLFGEQSMTSLSCSSTLLINNHLIGTSSLMSCSRSYEYVLYCKHMSIVIYIPSHITNYTYHTNSHLSRSLSTIPFSFHMVPPSQPSLPIQHRKNKIFYPYLIVARLSFHIRNRMINR